MRVVIFDEKSIQIKIMAIRERSSAKALLSEVKQVIEAFTDEYEIEETLKYGVIIRTRYIYPQLLLLLKDEFLSAYCALFCEPLIKG